MSTNHIQSETFLKHLTQYWKQYKIAERLDNLQTNHLDKNSLRSSLNNIDNDITKSLLRAENRSKRSERPPWSPDLKEASLQVKLLKLLFRQFVSNQPMTASIDHTTARINDNNNLPNPKTKQECQTLLRKAQKKLRKIRRRAQEKRTEYLNTLVQQYALQGNQQMESIIKRIKKAEATKRCYAKLRWILHPPKPGVTFVQRTTSNGTTKTLYDRQTLEHAILLQNKQHFNQCKGTPFTTGNLRKLNWAADSPLAETILEGNCDVNYLTSNPTTQFLLRQCKRLCDDTPLSITTQDLQGLFKRW